VLTLLSRATYYVITVTNGVAYIWASNYTENWSAFAPDFKELEENEEYTEREDEFDDIDNPIGKKRKLAVDEDVDIITNEKSIYFSSDEEDDLHFVPVTITRELPH